MGTPNLQTSTNADVLTGGEFGAIVGGTTSETVGFYGNAGSAQQTAAAETTGFTAGSGTAVKDDSTFTGGVGTTAYTIGDVVKVLKTLGVIAS